MESNQRATLAVELMQLITSGHAHIPFEDAVRDLPGNLRSTVAGNLPYSIWQLVEHIRITQWDIVGFCISAQHQSPKWPEGYWTTAVDKVDDSNWNNSLNQIRKDRDRFFDLLKDEKNNLLVPFPHGEGQHLFREAVVIADHNSYHIGQIIVIRRLLGNWK